MKTLNRTWAVAVIAALIGGMLAIGGAALAQDSDVTIRGCAKKNGRVTSITTKTPKCKKNQTMVTVKEGGSGEQPSMITATQSFMDQDIEEGEFHDYWVRCPEGYETMIQGYTVDPSAGVHVAQYYRQAVPNERPRVLLKVYADQPVSATFIEIHATCMKGVPEMGTPGPSTVAVTSGQAAG